MARRTGILVLGMHRSGTSALARTINLAGAALPLHVYGAAPGNDSGHWEAALAVRLNEQLLELSRSPVNDIHGPDNDWLRSDAALASIDRMADLITDEFADAPLFVLKDPRCTLLFPLWREALSRLDIRCVAAIIVRNPVEVALSLAARQALSADGESWPPQRGALQWLRYNLAAEAHTRGMDRAFCSYPALIEDWQTVLQQLGHRLGIDWPMPAAVAGPEIEAFLDRSQRHHRHDDIASARGIWSSWIAPVFSQVQRACGGGEPDPAIFDQVRRHFDEVYDDLVHPSADVPESIEMAEAAEPRVLLVRQTAQAIIAAGSGGRTGEVARQIRSLADALDDRTKSAGDAIGYAQELERRVLEAERYAQSLQISLGEARAANEAAADYARGLERARSDAEIAAGSLRKELSVLQALRADEAEQMQKRVVEAERYARSLEASLAEARAANEAAAGYARDLERTRAEAETYAKSLEAELAKRLGQEVPD